MRKILVVLLINLGTFGFAQQKIIKKKSVKPISQKSLVKNDLQKINDSIPALIPQKKDGKFGFINQKGKMLINNEYSNVGFFAEDCNLLNSPNAKLQKFGSKKYASVRWNGKDFRIDEHGKRVYQFKASDLGKCKIEYKAQLFHAYLLGDTYGIIEDSKFENPTDYRQYQIYPQYEYLHIMEGDDFKNPMIVAIKDEKFGVIDKNNTVIIPFVYRDIKKNFSWKLGRLFEVSDDGENYYFVDEKNTRY